MLEPTTQSSYQRLALADFLRTRRARLSPADVGLPNGRRRRTSGLRREEVSSLANVGISWYTALEQGQAVRPSEGILNSLADVLRLTAHERQHLFRLAGYSLVVIDSLMVKEAINPALHQILGALEPNPVYIIGLTWNYLAWNETAERVFSITQPQAAYSDNLLWQLFMNPAKREFFVHWEQVAQNAVAEFRTEFEKYFCCLRLNQLIADLRANSPDFDRLWQQHNVQRTVIRRKTIWHEQVGTLEFEHTPLLLAEHPTLKVIVYTPTPESAHRLEALRAGVIN